MRVATFNILNGRVPTDQHVDPGGLADAVKRLDADILALQEVDQNQQRSGFADDGSWRLVRLLIRVGSSHERHK